MNGRSAAARLAVVMAAWLAGCVPHIDTSHAPCPCGDGYECCPTVEANQCVERGHLERCTGSQGCPLPDGTEATLAIAEGFPDTTQSRPLDINNDMPLYFGVQGGFHIYLQLQLTRFYPNAVKVTRKITDVATGTLLRQTQTDVLNFVCDAGRWVLLTGQLTYVCPADPPGALTIHDRDLQVQIDLESQRTGQKLSRSFTVRPVCQPGDTSHYESCMNSPLGCGGGQGP